ncbi:Adenylate cyclase [Diplonema papillatum]|nr:Adenylate cyclase [Diplonema papillatum]
MVTPMTTRVPGHFVMALPIAFLMGTAQATLEKEIATNARERSRLNDRIASDLNTTGIVVAACALVVAFAMVIMSAAMLRPLQQLRRDMESVAEMRLDADPAIPGVYELQLIASSFRTMVRNLREFKAYVPRSVLNSSCDDIVFNVAPPAGNVTLVFTDIQNSTALWEKSPEDMDHALEQHNEVCFRKISHYRL